MPHTIRTAGLTTARNALCATLAILALSCAVGPGGGAGAPAAARAGAADAAWAPWDLPPLEDVVRVVESATGAEWSLADLLDDLAGADAVFLGETHLDETTHRVELAVYEGLLERRRGQVVLGLEMFARDAQAVVDRYVTGEMDEAAFLKASRPWGNYRTGYRALLQRARRDGRPVVAANLPTSVRRSVAFGGREAYDGLSAEQRALVAAELHPNSDAYWERFARVVRGHAAMIASDPERRLTSSQSLWDNTMGESCARALEARPDHLLLHVVGAFHSAYGEGTVEQFRRRRPQARVVTLAISPTSDLPGVEPEPGDGEADFELFAHARARGLEDDTHAVSVDRELRYRLAVPPAARDGRPVPLLVWLPEEGARAQDEAAWFELALGQDAAVAVVEMPFPQVEETLHKSGRWFWPGSFREDLGALQGGLTRLVGYVARHFPVDRERIVLAGRGAGATVVVSTLLRTQTLRVGGLAFEPARFGKLHENALPLEEPAALGVHVVARAEDQEWWTDEAAEYREVGLDITVDGAGKHVEDGGRLALDDHSRIDTEGALRVALGLESATAPAAGAAVHLLSSLDGPLARQWSRLYTQALARAGTRVEPSAESVLHLALPGEPGVAAGAGLPVEAFSDGRALPVAPGDFGGTTVLVLPDGVPDEARAAWQTIAESQAIRRRSPFSSLKIADASTLPDVLEEIRASGRSSVLIAPAVFCATAEQMRALRAAAGPLERLSVAWLPGLGGRAYLHALPDEEPEHG